MNQKINSKYINVRYDRRQNRLVVSYVDCKEGDKSGIEHVVGDGRKMPFIVRYVGGLGHLDYNNEKYYNYGEKVDFKTVLEALGVDFFEEYTEDELRLIEILLNEKMKESYSGVFVAQKDGSNELGFIKKGDVYLARSSYDENGKFKGYSSITSLDGNHMILIDAEKDKYMHCTKDGKMYILTQPVDMFKQQLNNEYFESNENVSFFAADVLKQKLKEKNASQYGNGEN